VTTDCLGNQIQVGDTFISVLSMDGVKPGVEGIVEEVIEKGVVARINHPRYGTNYQWYFDSHKIKLLGDDNYEGDDWE